MRYDPPRAGMRLNETLCVGFDGYNINLIAMNEHGSILFVTSLDSAALTKFLAFVRECGAEKEPSELRLSLGDKSERIRGK